MPGEIELADPFLLEHEGRTLLYVEEIPTNAGKGRLSCMVVEPNGFSSPVVVLETEHHTSYPCVFPHKGEVFMIPETAALDRIDLYRARKMPHDFQLETTLLEGWKAVDTTPVLIDGLWYFFTSSIAPFMQTFLFWSDRLDGKWRLHPSSPISSSVKSSRSAGALFWSGGRLLRPTQNCSLRYGYAMVLNEVKRITPTEFEEVPVEEILPVWRRGLVCTHTLNVSAAIDVIDGLWYK
jgi:hypothetical protein